MTIRAPGLNLFLRPRGADAFANRDKEVGTVQWCEDKKGARWAFRVSTSTANDHRNTGARGVNAAIVRELKREGVREVYRQERETKRWYRTTIDALERFGWLSPLRNGLGDSLNLAPEHWEAAPAFQKKWVPPSCRRVVPVDDPAADAA